MNAAEERAAALQREVSEWPIAEDERRAIEQRLETGWRSNGVIVSIVFFVLTLVAVAALFFLCELLKLPKGWITAGISIGVAEVLIGRFRFFGTGVESALWFGGLFAWIFGLPSEGKPEALLLFAAACAISGYRVRNPFIGSAGAIFVIAYLGAKHWYLAALVAGIVVAAFALFELMRVWQRPSTEILFILLLIVAPITGAASSIEHTSLLWAFAYVALAAAAFTFGVRGRHRGALYGGAVSTVIAVVVVRELFNFAPEWKCIAAGALLFGISVMISRALRTKRDGFVMAPMKTRYEEALVLLAPQSKMETAPQPVGGGGTFGGAGATGSF
jgi:hypothetical protein